MILKASVGVFVKVAVKSEKRKKYVFVILMWQIFQSRISFSLFFLNKTMNFSAPAVLQSMFIVFRKRAER